MTVSPRYFFWISGDFQRSGFQFQTSYLPHYAYLSFAVYLLCFPGMASKFFLGLLSLFRWLQSLTALSYISCSTFVLSLYINSGIWELAGAPRSSPSNVVQLKCATLSAACPVMGEEFKARIQEELKKAFCDMLPPRTNVFLARFYENFEVIMSSPALLF